jgi:hypothetical protein
MSDQQSLWPFSHDPSVVGHGAAATPVRTKLDLAQLLLRMSEIPVVTQNTQQGEFFRNRLELLFVSTRLALLTYSYFFYSFYAHTLAFIELDNLGEISLLPPSTQQPVSLTTVAPLPTANTAPNDPGIAPSLSPIAIDLTNDFGPPLTAREPPTDRQRTVILEVMETVWGISSPREF